MPSHIQGTLSGLWSFVVVLLVCSGTCTSSAVSVFPSHPSSQIKVTHVVWFQILGSPPLKISISLKFRVGIGLRQRRQLHGASSRYKQHVWCTSPLFRVCPLCCRGPAVLGHHCRREISTLVVALCPHPPILVCLCPPSYLTLSPNNSTYGINIPNLLQSVTVVYH